MGRKTDKTATAVADMAEPFYILRLDRDRCFPKVRIGGLALDQLFSLIAPPPNNNNR